MDKKTVDIIVFSRKTIAEFATDRAHIVISISEPASPGYPLIKAEIPDNPNCVGILYLDFCDMDAQRFPKVKELPETYKLFSEDDARSILKFVELTLPYVNLIAVNCPGGVSRSSAVAAAIAKIVGQSDEQFFNPKGPYTPNRFIYRTILNVAMDSRPIGDNNV
jgi:predicted protein tyrosine phosphatase